MQQKPKVIAQTESDLIGDNCHVKTETIYFQRREKINYFKRSQCRFTDSFLSLLHQSHPNLNKEFTPDQTKGKYFENILLTIVNN